MLDRSVWSNVQNRILKLKQTLPAGSDFQFDEADRYENGWDGLFVGMLSLPAEARRSGIATKFMAEFLAITDDLGVTTGLDADPTQKRGDPSLFDLARWYRRFGFEMKGLTDEGRLHMRRNPGERGCGAAAILAAYAEARAARDLTREEFERAIRFFVNFRENNGEEEWARQFRARGY